MLGTTICMYTASPIWYSCCNLRNVCACLYGTKPASILTCVPGRLVEALDVYWGRTEQTFTQEDTLRGFPSSLTVDQAVATWKYVADYKIKRH